MDEGDRLAAIGNRIMAAMPFPCDSLTVLAALATTLQQAMNAPGLPAKRPPEMLALDVTLREFVRMYLDYKKTRPNALRPPH